MFLKGVARKTRCFIIVQKQPIVIEPRLVVVAGVNGRGKSTLTQNHRFNRLRTIDPDAIAKSLTQSRSESASLRAGRAAIEQRQNFLNERKSFVLETTLSGKDVLRFMQTAASTGFKVEFHYVYLLDVQQSVERVAARVAKGGHHILLKDIQRRFSRSRQNFAEAAKVAHLTVAYDNTSLEAAFEPVFWMQGKDFEIAADAAHWLQNSVKSIQG